MVEVGYRADAVRASAVAQEPSAHQKYDIPVKDIEILRRARSLNPWWYKAMMQGARTMTSRVRKYSGEVDPYTNFIIMARLMGKSVTEIFRYYIGLKFARHLVETGDFEDETDVDTDIDGANYFLLSAGWKMREAPRNTAPGPRPSNLTPVDLFEEEL